MSTRGETAVRNVDRIKELEYELGRWQDKSARQKTEILVLKEQMEAADAGLREMSAAVDSVLVGLAIQYGTALPDGGLKISVPAVTVERSMRDYRVTAEVSADNERYEVVVRKAGE